MKRLTTIITLFVQLLPLIVLAQQEQVLFGSAGFAHKNLTTIRMNTGATTPWASDSAYHIRYPYLCKGSEKMLLISRRGFLQPDIKAKFKPYPNAHQEILQFERHNRRTLLWAWGGLGIGVAALTHSLVSKNNGRYDDAINIGSTALISIAGITATYHMILAHDSRRAAVDYLNLRQ
jgi:hypothetical protein